MIRRPRSTAGRLCTAALLAGVLGGATVLAWPVQAVPARTTVTVGPSPKGLLWSADPHEGASEFSSVECPTNDFTTKTDTEKGLVWQAKQRANVERCEPVGPTVASGSTYYLGWSSKFHITDSTSRYIFQLKCSPSDGTANHPVVLEVNRGSIQLQSWTHQHTRIVLWSTKAVNDRWNDFALRISEDRKNGSIQFWFNGVPQKLSNGSFTFTGTTYDGTRDYLKWGLYHPAPETATQWLTTIKMGHTLSDVTG
ncbi:heparin lyase I family protein [Streptomyces sp. DB-54]